MLFTNGEHMMTQAVALSSPASEVHARNAWDHDPLLAAKTLAFYDSGFPHETESKLDISN